MIIPPLKELETWIVHYEAGEDSNYYNHSLNMIEKYCGSIIDAYALANEYATQQVFESIFKDTQSDVAP